MSEKSWSSIAPPHATQVRVQKIGEIFAGMDASSIEPLPSTPQEFLNISQDSQAELEGPMKDMIGGITTVLAKADREIPQSEEAPDTFDHIFLSKERAQELDDYKKRMDPLRQRLFAGSDNATLEERYDYRLSSPTKDARAKWDKQFDHELTQTEVIVFDISDVIDEEFTFSNFMALPVIGGDTEKTLKLVSATRNALKRFSDIAKDADVVSFLESNDFSKLNFARNHDRGASIKLAPLRMFAEAIATTTELTALAVADMETDIDVGMAVCELAKKNFFGKTALGISMGVVGPLANAGVVPKGGLVEKNDTGRFEINKAFMDNISRKTKENKQYVNAVMGIYGLYKHLHPKAFEADEPEQSVGPPNYFVTEAHHNLRINSGEHSLPKLFDETSDAFDKYNNDHGYFNGEGCPAVFFAQEGGTSPISLTTKWVLKPYMPQRKAE